MIVRFDADRENIERRLDEICASYLSNVPSEVADAIRYGLKSPGKRLRPLLLLFAYRAAGGSEDATLLACAPEVIHAYSLMHDDLPCMDDVLDVTSTVGALGKTTGRDAKLGKSTYPALLGVEGARQRAQSLIDDGLQALADEQLLTQELSQVANFMLSRTS